MSKKYLKRFYLSLVLLFVTATQISVHGIPAFPGAEGFGANSIGGRGGTVIKVTNLNASGPGSLQAACSAAGPRIVIFDISGTIVLTSGIDITNPYITIAGQTAPGDGICLKGGGFDIATHDVIIRGIRIRVGDVDLDDPSTSRGICMRGNDGDINNNIVDHCSLSWAIDKTVSLSSSTQPWGEFNFNNVTVQWCIISEGLSNSYHILGLHSKGLLVMDEARNLSIHHNLFAHNAQRNPYLTSATTTEVINNVVYNWEYWATHLGNNYGRGPLYSNLIGNYYKRGQDSNPALLPGSLDGGTCDLWLGRDSDIGCFFDGQMDEVAIYDRALTENEIMSCYTTGPVTGAIASWYMDSFLPSTYSILDSSGNGNTGITIDMDSANLQNSFLGTSHGNSLLFDGTNEYMEIDQNFKGQLESFTVSMWIKCDDLSTMNGLFFGLNGHSLYPRLFIREGGGLKFQFKLNGYTQSVLTAPGTITVGQPYHIVALLDNPYTGNPKAYIYVNGVDKSSLGIKGIYIMEGASAPEAGSQFYVQGNIGPGRPVDTGDEWDAVSGDTSAAYRSTGYAITPSGISVDSPTNSYTTVLEFAGAVTPRDSVDDRITASVKDGTGHIIDSQDDVGGWPTYNSGTALVDTDDDGMPDTWELEHGLNQNDPADANNDTNGDGYTNIEEYINSYFPLIKNLNLMFNEGSGTATADSSVLTNNGTLVNMDWTNCWIDGKFGKALEFDGVDDYVDCGNDASLTPIEEMTIESWVKLSVKKPYYYQNTVVNAYGAQSGYVMRVGDAKVNFWIGDGTLTHSINGQNEFSLNEWHHLVITYKANQYIKSYIDGVLDKNTPITYSMANNQNAKTISQEGALKCFNGAIDEVNIYNRVLAPYEVYQRYLDGASINLNNYTLAGYGGQDVDINQYSILDSGATLRMWGNNWKAVNKPYIVRPDTILEFDFKSTGAEGEINGVGLDTDLMMSSSQFFKIHGTQNFGNLDFDDYSGSDWKHYVIPIGKYFTGYYNYIFFANDADAGQNTDVQFRNIVLR